ncbi:hypothetical protein C8R47DRAFT_1043727 [Mycena vitilis]|nr:hypothetical protein C8R47DRAFT_1043727 [Mycena vitilis]
MKLTSYLFLLPFLVTSTLAQGIRIAAPANGATVSAGSAIVVDVERPDTLTPSTQLALAIGFSPCNSGACRTPLEELDTVLYNGTFDPQFRDDGDRNRPHQNFTVTIPVSAPRGTALLSVINFSLVGAVSVPLLQALNITVQVE